jgi:hypothetical protein
MPGFSGLPWAVGAALVPASTARIVTPLEPGSDGGRSVLSGEAAAQDTDIDIQAGTSGDLHPTGARSRTGRRRRPMRADERMKWRSAAGRLLVAAAATRARVRTSVVFKRYPARRPSVPAAAVPVMSAPFLPGLVDELREPAIIVFREVVLRDVEEGGDDVGGRAVEEGLSQVGEGAPPRLVLGQPGDIDIAGSVLPVDEVSLLLEDAEQGADGRVAGRRRQAFQDLGSGGLFHLIDDVHDLALPAAQILVGLHLGPPIIAARLLPAGGILIMLKY